MENIKWKNLQSWLQRLMVIVAVLLLIACFIVVAPLKTDNPSDQSFLWIVTLMLFIGAVGFYISKALKPLDSVIVGSFLGTCICLCELFGFSNDGFSAGMFSWLFMLELLLSASYRIGRRFGIFV